MHNVERTRLSELLPISFTLMALTNLCVITYNLHILKVDELLRVCNHVWYGSPYRKVSIAFIVDKLLHGSKYHPEGGCLKRENDL